ncbi:hypothetical protein ACET3Z_007864 [Daucus carota]
MARISVVTCFLVISVLLISAERNVAGVNGQKLCGMDVNGDSCLPGVDGKCQKDCVKLVQPKNLRQAFCRQDTKICRCIYVC